MACSTGEACGFTDTRSSGRRWLNHSSVMIDTSDADEAWWPPTFSPSGLGRTRLAWCTIDVASHNTRCSTSLSVASRSIRPPSSRLGPLHHRCRRGTIPDRPPVIAVLGVRSPETAVSADHGSGEGGVAAAGAGGALAPPKHQLGKALLRVPGHGAHARRRHRVVRADG